MKKLNIAIFGSNLHIAKGLISRLIKLNNVNLHLYSTKKDKLFEFEDDQGKLL